MVKHVITLLFLFWFVDSTPLSVSESIRLFIENKPVDGHYSIDNERLYSSKVLPLFYEHRQFKTAWFTESGKPGQSAVAMLAYIRKVDSHGLQPSDYHLQRMETLFRDLPSADIDTRNEIIMKLDLLLSDAFFIMGAHLFFGKVDPESVAASWNIQRNHPELRLDIKLEKALSTRSVTQALESLCPQSQQYQTMRKALTEFRSKEQSSLTNIVIDQSIKPGSDHPKIPEIRHHIIQLDIQLTDSNSTTYDQDLEIAVKTIQKRWGLNPDGVIGKNTVEILNYQTFDYVQKLECNLERMRWMPDSLPEKLIEVNIANFELDFIVNSDTVFRTRAIVGKSYRKTPVFNSRITYMVFSPGWVVPPGIFANDVLPQLKNGPGYLQEKNMQILTHTGVPVEYSTIDWSKVSARNFPYMIRQLPGPQNALGRVKFMFPNSYNVYIHDTPTRNLFTEETRTLSSGCIRIENPLKLAELLLEQEPGWDAPRILKAAESGKEQTVRLSVAVPVQITYFTCWSDASGKHHWRRDIYNRDAPLAEALREKPTLR